MCNLEAHLQCSDRFFEVFSNEIELNELMLESIFSQLLIKFFKHVMVEVGVSFPPQEELAMQYCAIEVYAKCDDLNYASLPDTHEHLEVRIEQKMCSILRELFCSVFVDEVTIIPSQRDNTFARSRAGTK